ncbi:hypothetical protein MKX03_022543 [Papaver bracteatum]|nr:hypothetical protein MKX03_022543 [Papaver bracteatum]
MYKMKKGFVSALASSSSIINRPIINQTKMTVRGCTTSSKKQGGFVVKAEVMESEDSMMSLYERWMEHFQIYRYDMEKHQRFQVFRDRVIRFRSANCLADISDKEFNKRKIKRFDFGISRARLPAPKNEVT